MALSNLQVFNEYFMPAIVETFAEKVQLFNVASNGAILLDSANFRGALQSTAFFANVVSAQRRVNRKGPNTDAPVTNISNKTRTEIKVAGGFGPVVYEPSELTWLEHPTGEGIAIASESFADALLYDQINTALGTTIAAISGNQKAIYGSGKQELNYIALNRANSLFGASSNLLATTFMSGATYHKFVEQNLKNAPSVLFKADNVLVVDILGKKVVVVDAPALSTHDGLSRALSLVPNAVTINDPKDMQVNIETKNGKQRLETSFQADYTFNIAMKGYSWDAALGGECPMDPELLSSYNWKLDAANIKQTAGVLAVGY